MGTMIYKSISNVSGFRYEFWVQDSPKASSIFSGIPVAMREDIDVRLSSDKLLTLARIGPYGDDGCNLKRLQLRYISMANIDKHISEMVDEFNIQVEAG